MKKIGLIVIVWVALTSVNVLGQSYGTALGLRMGNSKARTVGLTFQQRILKNVTLEGIAQSDFNRNTTGHFLVKRHRGFLTKRFNIYGGAGLSFGVEESEVEDPVTKEVKTTFNNTTFGTDIMMGVEFTLLRYNFSFDYKPNFNLVGREPWFQGQVGFSARTVIVKGSTQNKRKRKRARAKRKKEREKEKTDKEESPLLKDWFQRTFKKKDG